MDPIELQEFVKVKTLDDVFKYIVSKNQIPKEKYHDLLNFQRWANELAKHSITNVNELMKY